MRGRMAMSGWLLALALVSAGMAQQLDTGPIREQRLQWDWQAESTFRIGRGLARKLMTEAEWLEHRERMRAMSREEREQYRAQIHGLMMQRFEEMGIRLPQGPSGPGEGPT